MSERQQDLEFASPVADNEYKDPTLVVLEAQPVRASTCEQALFPAKVLFVLLLSVLLLIVVLRTSL